MFESFCREHNIVVRTDIPFKKTRGFTFYYDNEYIIFLNPHNSYYQNKKTLIHEILHILNNDFEQSRNKVFECEKNIENMVDSYLDRLEFSY